MHLNPISRAQYDNTYIIPIPTLHNTRASKARAWTLSFYKRFEPKSEMWSWILQFKSPLLKSSSFSSIKLISDISNLFIPLSFPYLLCIFHLISHSSDHLSAWWFPSAFIPLRAHSSSNEYINLLVAGFRDLFILWRCKILFLFWQSIIPLRTLYEFYRIREYLVNSY